MSFRWSKMLVDQLDFYWNVHLRPRLDGLTDEEYLWEPVPGCLSVRPSDDGFDDGFVIEEAPGTHVTTIAWRMMHIAVGVLGNRANAYFGPSIGESVDMFDKRFEPAPVGTADEAIALLEHSYHHWMGGISALDDSAMLRPLGPMGGPYAEGAMAELVLHLSRETMHHGAEIALLRDLFPHR